MKLEVGTGFEPVYTDLQSVASPLGQPTTMAFPNTKGTWERPLRADNETRTRDLNLGKVALYQLSYVRLQTSLRLTGGSASGTVAHGQRGAKITPGCRGAGRRPQPREPSRDYARLMRAWLNGDLLDDPTGAVLSVTDHGFTVGDGVFESIKTLHGEPFALTRHLQRLARSANGLGLVAPDDQDVRRGVAEVLAGNNDPLGRLRITYTAGPAPMGSGRGDGPATLVVAYSTINPMPVATAVATVPWLRNEHGATAGLKTTSYAENVIALAHASERGASEAIFANTAGHLCEGTGSNIFYVVDGELRTPTLAGGCLAGVTRALVLEWCGGVEIDEPISVIEQASEAFLVSTTRDVQAISRWDDRDLPAPGPITAECMQTWARREAEHLDP